MTNSGAGTEWINAYTKATQLAMKLGQVTGENSEYFITLAQLEQIFKDTRVAARNVQPSPEFFGDCELTSHDFPDGHPFSKYCVKWSKRTEARVPQSAMEPDKCYCAECYQPLGTGPCTKGEE